MSPAGDQDKAKGTIMNSSNTTFMGPTGTGMTDPMNKGPGHLAGMGSEHPMNRGPNGSTGMESQGVMNGGPAQATGTRVLNVMRRTCRVSRCAGNRSDEQGIGPNPDAAGRSDDTR